MKTGSIRVGTLVICALPFFPSLATAELVPIAITAEVTDVWDDYDFLEGKVNIGDLMTGVYIYDTSTPDSNPWEHRGTYRHYAPPCGILLNIVGFIVGTNPDDVHVTITVDDDIYGIDGNKKDCFYLYSQNNLSFSDSDFLISEIFLSLIGGSCETFSSDALPTTAPPLDVWETQYIHFTGGYPRQGFCIYGNLTSAVLIPEPATVVLVGMGSLALLVKRRHSRSKSCKA